MSACDNPGAVKMTRAQTVKLMFQDCSPARLAFALDYKINLVREQSGTKIRIFGKSKNYNYEHIWNALARLAAVKGVNPNHLPANYPRALINGQAQQLPPAE